MNEVKKVKSPTTSKSGTIGYISQDVGEFTEDQEEYYKNYPRLSLRVMMSEHLQASSVRTDQ